MELSNTKQTRKNALQSPSPSMRQSNQSIRPASSSSTSITNLNEKTFRQLN